VPGLCGGDGDAHPPGEIVLNPIMGIVIPKKNPPEDHGDVKRTKGPSDDTSWLASFQKGGKIELKPEVKSPSTGSGTIDADRRVGCFTLSGSTTVPDKRNPGRERRV